MLGCVRCQNQIDLVYIKYNSLASRFNEAVLMYTMSVD